MSEITVLITGAGAPGASGIIKSLRAADREIRIVGVDVNADAYGFAFTDAEYTVPYGDEEGYIPRLTEIAAAEAVDVVLPLTTREISPLSAHRNRFDATVMVSPFESLQVANNKGRLYDFLESEGFDSAPAFRQVGSKDAFVKAVKSLGYPDQPVCFKPPVASGMRGFRILDESTDRTTRLLEEKPGTPITTLSEILPVLSAADQFPELAVMEYLPGEEYSVDTLAMGEEVGPVVPRSRSRTRAGITFEGTVEQNEQLIEESREICEALGLEYNINLQFRYNADGEPKLIEINPRVSGTIIMCVGAGVNLPALGVTHALGEPLPSTEIDWGTQMVRYWDELFQSPSGERFQLREP